MYLYIIVWSVFIGHIGSRIKCQCVDQNWKEGEEESLLSKVANNLLHNRGSYLSSDFPPLPGAACQVCPILLQKWRSLAGCLSGERNREVCSTRQKNFLFRDIHRFNNCGRKYTRERGDGVNTPTVDWFALITRNQKTQFVRVCAKRFKFSAIHSVHSHISCTFRIVEP